MEGVVEAPIALVARVAEVDVGGERDLLLLGHLALANLDHPASVPVRVLLADDLLDVGLHGPLRRRVQHDGDADRAHVRPLPSRGVLHLVRLARRKVGTKVARLAGRRRLKRVDEAGVLQAAVPRLPPRAPAMQNVGLRRPGTGRERGVSSEEPSYKRGVQRRYKGGQRGVYTGGCLGGPRRQPLQEEEHEVLARRPARKHLARVLRLARRVAGRRVVLVPVVGGDLRHAARNQSPLAERHLRVAARLSGSRECEGGCIYLFARGSKMLGQVYPCLPLKLDRPRRASLHRTL